MASEVDVCNLALSHLGDEAAVVAITPPDGTTQAGYCATFYPIARDLLLEMHPWTFATRRAAMAEVTNPSPDDWSYCYKLPTGCIRPLSALLAGQPERYFSSGDTDAGSHPFIVEAGADGNAVLYTNVETATLRYIHKATDTSKYTPAFVVALARLLAVYLAGPILKGDTGANAAAKQMQIFAAAEFPKAAAANSNVGKRNVYETFRPSWLATRGAPMVTDGPVYE